MRLLVDDWFMQDADGLALKGWTCGECGRTTFPRKYICPHCGADALSETRLGKSGTLHTYTRTYIAGPDAPAVPYVIGFVDVPEGVRLIAPITDCEPWDERLSPDMAVEMVFGELRRDADGESVHSYMFRPAGAAA